MSLLPSPIPHPLDYSPWQLPGWVYEALDWVIGVEWPEGNERAVWELADQWYAVAAALAGPRADAIAAAGEVRGGYGGVGAVATAFDTAWRRVAEGDEAPLPVLLTVSTELGRLVEECGCDIEGAKLEVWIELGILVVELLSLAVATVLTAGAASPAAGVAITATRLIVQQIFKRLMAQLARKSLKQGLKEAGERAAKEVTKGGVRGFSRRAAVSGLSEAAEESGINLATQAYQNSTGRRHGLDVTELGTTALGGMAGGMVAPLAGLGRHATGRGARVGEHFGREMAGEVMADQAASLATGQGLTSVEDAARAAASGARGSATAQADAALQARLDGQLSALAGMPLTSSGAGGLPTPPGVPGVDGPPVVVPGAGTGSSVAVPGAEADSPAHGSGALASAPGEGQRGVTGTETAPSAQPSPGAQTEPADRATTTATRAGETTASVTAAGIERTGATLATTSPVLSESVLSPTLSSVTTAAPVLGAGGVSTGVDGQATIAGNAAGGAGSVSVTSAAGPSNAPAASAGGPSTGMGMGTATVGPAPVSFPEPRTGASASAAGHVPPAVTPEPSVARGSAGAVPAQSQSAQHAAPPTLLPSPAAPTSGQNPPVHSDPAESGGRDGADGPRFRTPEWYAAKWALDRDAFERRRYRGYYESQRAWFEDKRRFDEAVRLRARADEHHHRAQDFAAHAFHLHRTGQARQADGWQWAANDEMRAYGHYLDYAEAVLAGSVVPSVVGVVDPADFRRINDDVGDLAYGAVETADRSALTGDDHPPPIDRSRNYGRPGGLRPPLALHQTDIERQVPREPDGSVRRNADPRTGGWFGLVNDGGPQADPTRGINCIDCTLSLFDTWVHGRPRVSAPRTFDAYVAGDVARPINGERDGTGRVEDVTGGRFQRLCQPTEDVQGVDRQRAIDSGYRNLHAQLRLGGHGSFAFVVNSFEQGGSHIWVALNQNGTILYLDPQSGAVSDVPLYQHRGTPYPYNAVDTEVLVLGSDGRPMPLGGLRRGRFSERPDLPQYPPAETDQGYGELYLNRLYLLDGPGSVGSGPSLDDDPPDQTGPAESSSLLGQLSHQEQSVLATLRGRAVAAADEIENALTQAGRRVTESLRLDHPIILRDQEFRVKALDSLLRKYLDEAQVVGVSVEEFSHDVNDVLRFSFSMPPKNRYRGAVRAILVELREMGFIVGDEDCKNFWRPGNRFYGFNCAIISPGGQTFELQLHSDSSRNSWMLTHQSYEVLRRSSEPPERRIHALMQMLSVNRQSGMPDQIPIGLPEEFPAKDATFAKWILVNRVVWSDYLRWLRREGRSFSQVVQEFGLAVEDFPIAQELLDRLEKSDVDLLRNLPRRHQS
ncbi:toxin glutamine deamidase domain-containing protein [Micromonospora peucetia]|uniref:toxin glutamine deamidase domain-containing protein n=1 Tax=Micromonospora peucetia TaxID=47871 RepID=UPI0033295EF3